MNKVPKTPDIKLENTIERKGEPYSLNQYLEISVQICLHVGFYPMWSIYGFTSTLGYTAAKSKSFSTDVFEKINCVYEQINKQAHQFGGFTCKLGSY